MSISTEEKDRYLRETAIVLAREGFQTGKTDTGKLRVLLDGAPLCEVTENGGITYRNEDIMEKLGAVVTLAEPKSAAQIKNLAENLDLFDFAPGTHTPEEYGKYMIRQSGHFDYDENLDAFYDYEKYGTERMNAEDGMFTDRGYIAYKGYTSMEEVMNGSQSSHMEMGGFSR